MISRTASCHCGQLDLICTGEPRKTSMCHCVQCQRRTGSLFSIAVFYTRDHVTIDHGTTHSFERQSASGFPVAFHFCPHCGSNLFWEPARMPHLVGVAAGAFANPGFPLPEQSVWMKESHPWFILPEGIAVFDANPSPRA